MIVRLITGLTLATTIICGTAGAAGIEYCSTVLVPNEEQSRFDYAMMQAYMKLSSTDEYDRLKRLSKDKLSAEASYKLFSAEYDSSATKEEFQEKVRRRLDREGFSMSINEAKALHRRYLDPGQVTAWEKCIAQNADGGALLLSTSMPNKKQFALVVNWIPPKGVAQGQLDLKLAGGTIEGNSAYTKTMKGKSDVALIVVPNVGAQSVLIAANIAGYSESIDAGLEFSTTEWPVESGGMLGDMLTVARRYPDKNTPYWTPLHTITVQTKADATKPASIYIGNSAPWGASISAGAREIRFQLPNNPSSYISTSAVFDGFLISGFSKSIKSIALVNKSNLIINATHTSREIQMAISGEYQPNTVFSLRVAFDE